jgi:molybdopterin-guanine dinucleotide biosynthesis protein A
VEAPPGTETPRGTGFRSAALLAGGGGRRLGGLDKQELACADGEALGRRIARRLLGRWPELVVVGKRPELYAGLGVLAGEDLLPGAGALSGLHAALSRSSSPWTWLMACDMPRFDPALPELLESRIVAAEAAGMRPVACLIRYGGHFEPFQAYWSRALLPKLEALIASFLAGTAPAAGGEGLGLGAPRSPSFRELLDGESVLWIEEAEARRRWPDWSPWRNINTPGELEAWRAAEAAAAAARDGG